MHDDLSGAKDGRVGWNLTIQGAHLDDRVTPEGVVGVLQPLVVIEPSEGMTERDETREWQTFMAACGWDGLTGDRLLSLRIEHPRNGKPGVLEICHLAAAHSFEVPDDEWSAFEQISKLASVPVVYKFRSRPDLVYRGVVTDASGSVRDLSGDGPEYWISRFGRAHRPNPHVNAMQPVSANLVAGASPAEVFAIDLTKFTMPAKSNCVMCAQSLAGEKTNREHVVPDWIRSLVSQHLSTPVDGVVAVAHESCNAAHSRDEDVIRGLTTRDLSGEDLTDDELSIVAYWMGGRMTLIDRAVGIEAPKASAPGLVLPVSQGRARASVLRPTRRRRPPCVQDPRTGTLGVPLLLDRGRLCRGWPRGLTDTSTRLGRFQSPTGARPGAWRDRSGRRALHQIPVLHPSCPWP